ncbi:MAG: hypothetical protein IT480_13705 [Gammaproteobacteria bacterium]|nr:hypothetical protein [Gammaproteobacteria bacterium]
MAHRSSKPAAATIGALAAPVALLALAIAWPAHGALPLVAGLGKQLIKNLLIDTVKSQLIGSLADSGCKGAALASVLSSSGSSRIGLPAGLPSMPGGVSAMAAARGMPQGLPHAAAGLPALPAALPAGIPTPMPGLPGPAGAIAVPGTAGAFGSAQMMAMLQQQMAARGMPALSDEQTAQVQSSMAMMQQAMAQPLSRAETIEVFDELGRLGVMTPAMQAEARDCIALAPPAVGDSLGMSGALLKNMVLPRLREARERMANLTPEEREHLAGEIAQAMRDAEPEDRDAFADGFGAGFFPPDVVEAVKAKLR